MRTHGFILWRDRLRRTLAGLRGRDPHAPFRLPEGRRRSGARAGVAIVAIIRDEAPYLAEWIVFHAMLGVRAFYLYDNGSTDGTAALLASRDWGAEVRRIDWASFDGLNATQAFAYSHALANYGADHRWMAFIDVDEFLFPLKGDDLAQTLAGFAGQPGLSLPWFNFGPDGHRTPPPGPVIGAYRERGAFPPGPDQASLLRFKSIVDPAEISHGGTHHFGYRGHGLALFNEAGEMARPDQARRPGFARSDILRLNHYFTRSEAELAAKLAKGRVSANGALNMAAYDRRMAQYARATVRDETILRFLPALEARLAGQGAAAHG